MATSYSLTAQVSINTDGADPDASSMLDIKSTDKGILIPRITTAQRDAIGSPATGLMVFNSDDNSFYFYNGTNWQLIKGATGHSLDAPDGDPLDAVYVDNDGNVGIGTNSPSSVLDVRGNTRIWDGTATINNATGAKDLYVEGKIESDNRLYGTTLNTGQGNNELYEMNQDVKTTSGVNFSYVNTGQGNNELYDMNQNVLTTSSVTFWDVNATGNIISANNVIAGTNIGGEKLIVDHIDTGHGVNELFGMNQDVKTTSAVTFSSINTGQGNNYLFDMDQNVKTNSVVFFAQINTGQGYNQLYGMDQHVKTTSDVYFQSVTMPRFYESSDTWYARLANTGSNGIAITPHQSNYGQCGNLAYYWDDGYFSELYRDTEYTISDKSFKQNIATVEGAIETIKKLRGVQYDIRTDVHPFYRNAKADELAYANGQLGFIAQELQEAIPEMVVKNEEGNFLMVRNYEQLLPVLVEGIKEQQAIIEDLETEIEQIKAALNLK